MIDLTELRTPDIFTALFHLSNLVAFLSFLLRDQMKLRITMGVSLLMQAAYYYSIPGGPLIDPLFWKIVSFLANLFIIVIFVHDNLDIGIPEYLRGLFTRLRVLSPGQFRKLVSKVARIEGQGQTILAEGQYPDKLYFLLRGEAQVGKGSAVTPIPSGTFLGEIAFLSGVPATATVTLSPGALAVAWNSAALQQMMDKNAAIDIAMRGFFNHDLAGKVARSMPIAAKQPAAAPGA
ncbi:MAG: cyclic nucleotide-binding domain-containing protein [Proteobacteria bacterium]|nr:cyclic nucleotide-binding domain-containing protein [Pseudomonadota bacterium]